MGFLSRFEGKMEDTFEGAADRMANAPISPVQIAKKAEKQMKREKMVGAGKQFAPTLYTVLVNPDDDQRLFGYYPTLAGETETYLAAKASEQGLVMDGQPLVRFIVDDGLKHGKFDIIAEAVAAPIIAQLRAEEMERYGLAAPGSRARAGMRPQQFAGMPARGQGAPYQAPVQQPYGAPAPASYGAQAVGGYDGYDDFSADPAFQAGPADGAGSYDPYAPSETAAPGGKPPLPYVPEDELDYSVDYGEYTFDSRDFDEGRDGPAPRSAQAADPYYAAPAPGGAFGGVAGAAAAAGAVGAGAGANMAAQPVARAADTVVFAGGAQGANPVPAQSAVRARLVDTTNYRTYDLATARLLMGRESKNDIVIPDLNASRQHAELRLEPQGVWVITDLGSTNGTFVNDREITAQPLSEGDRITIGVTNFVFTQA